MQEWVAQLDSSTKEIIALLRAAQANDRITSKPYESSWSILDILEHILLVESGIVRFLTSSANTTNIDAQPVHVGDERITKAMADRELKIKAPNFTEPIGLFTNVEDAIARFSEHRAVFMAISMTGKIVWDNTTRKHPVFGEMSKSDWLTFLFAHTQRHVLQMQDNLTYSYER